MLISSAISKLMTRNVYHLPNSIAVIVQPFYVNLMIIILALMLIFFFIVEICLTSHVCACDLHPYL